MEIRAANWKDRILARLGRRRLLRIEGESMSPTLKNGDVVLLDPKAKGAVGDIVAARHPYKKSVKVIKRIKSVGADSRYVLTGDNPDASTDSRSFGSIPERDILGKVVTRVR